MPTKARPIGEVSKNAERLPEERQAVSRFTYEVEMDRLNEAQRKAVETIEGPVMVVAGPGTGKTQVLALRVANILKKTQMRPSNILCLTFSMSGASAMRDRLRSLIGADAYAVKVSTIHGFCNEIIQSNPHVFDDFEALTQISDVERYRTVNGIIDSLLPDLVLVNRKRPHTKTRDILGQISKIKREGKDDIKELQKIADAYEQDLASRSKEGTKVHEKNLLTAQKFREFVTVFQKYQENLRTTGRYDYDDMILRVIEALETEEWLLASLQERYQYILVDEFQDTNGAQQKMIDTLTTYATIDHQPNLFVVGDDDQAIYRFQGANVTNLLAFHSRFPNAPIIPLTISYRSTQEILDAASSLISHNTERLVGKIEGLKKDLQSINQKQETKNQKPILIYAASSTIEPWLIADLIEDRLSNGMKSEEIAILTRTNAELRPIYDVLRAREIPVHMSGKINLLAQPLIGWLVAVLKAIHKPEDSVALATALHAPQLACHPVDVARLLAVRREREESLLSVLINLDMILTAGDLTLFDHTALTAARDKILTLQYDANALTVSDVIEKVIRTFNFIDRSENAVVDPLDVAALDAFYSFVSSRADETAKYTFRDLMRDLTLYEEPEYGDLHLEFTQPQVSEHGVQLMTAHQSKGLEFETVILTNFREGHWDKRKNPPSLSIPEDLLFGWGKEQKSYEEDQDERRLAFVAMTRAKHELLFTCPKEVVSGDRARSASPSAFFAEAGTLPEDDREVRHPEKASMLLHTPSRDLSGELQAFLHERLQTFELSASSLNKFLRDPQQFLMEDLLQMPQPMQPEFTFGSAVHDALRKWGLSVQEGKPLTNDQVLEAFEAYLTKKIGFNEGLFRNLLKEGHAILPRFYEQKLLEAKTTIWRIEHPVKAHLHHPSDPDASGIPLKGFIDRIDIDHPDSRRAVLIDYKTGVPKTESQIRDGDLYRQLTFYALLFDLGNPPVEPHTYILEFTGSPTDHPVSRSFQIPEQDRADMQKLIRDVWAKIQALDFTPLA